MDTVAGLLDNLYKVIDEQKLQYDLSFVQKPIRPLGKEPVTCKVPDSVEQQRDRLFKTGSQLWGYQFENAQCPQVSTFPSPRGPAEHRRQMEQSAWEHRKRSEFQKGLNFALRQQKVASMNQSAISFNYYKPHQEHFNYQPRKNQETLSQYIPDNSTLKSDYRPAYKSQMARTNDSSQFTGRMHRRQGQTFKDDDVRTRGRGVYYPQRRDYDLAAPWRRLE